MGCPPDPIDVSLWRGNDSSKELKEKATLLIPQARKAAQFLVELGKNHTGILSKAMQTRAEVLNKDAAHFSAEDLGKTFGYDDFENSYSGYPNMSVMYAHLDDSEKYVKKIEINLCITRDLLLKAVSTIGEQQLSEKEKQTYLEEKALHLLHRREDRDIKLKTLENEISTCQFVITTDTYDYPKEERDNASEKLKQLEPEYQRILALTDKELLQNRDLF